MPYLQLSSRIQQSGQEAGVSSAQVPLIVARYGGEDALMGKVAVAVQLQQSDDDALLAAHLFAAILERSTVYGGSLQVSTAGLLGNKSVFQSANPY